MKSIRKLALGVVVVAPLVAGGFIAQERATQDGGRLLGQVLDLVQSRFVDSIDEGMLYEKAARGLVGQLQDPYSELLSPHQLTQFNTTTGGRYGGLGMSIEEQRDKGTVVAKVFHNSPAEAAGIREGDMIIMIDTLSTRGWNNARVADSLRGAPGSKVSVTFARPGVAEPIKNSFTRAVIRPRGCLRHQLRRHRVPPARQLQRVVDPRHHGRRPQVPGRAGQGPHPRPAPESGRVSRPVALDLEPLPAARGGDCVGARPRR
jgi:hypothetical protein